MADTYDLTVKQQAALGLVVTWTGGAGAYPDWTAKGQIRKSENQAAELLLDLGAYLTAAVSGSDLVVTLAVPGNVTETLSRGGFYDIFVYPTGAPEAAVLLTQGKAILDKAVTVL